MGATIITTLGLAAKEVFTYLGKKILTIVSYVGLATGILTLIPLDIELPEFLIEIFKSDFLKNILQSISYFFPVSFALKCLALLFLSKYLGLLINLIIKIYRVVAGGLNGN